MKHYKPFGMDVIARDPATGRQVGWLVNSGSLWGAYYMDWRPVNPAGMCCSTMDAAKAMLLEWREAGR